MSNVRKWSRFKGEQRIIWLWSRTMTSQCSVMIDNSSHTGVKLLNSDWLRQRAFFFITRAIMVIKRAWLLDADWLSTPAISWIPDSNGFWKEVSETHRCWLWSKCGYSIHLNVKEIQRAAKRNRLVAKEKDFSIQICLDSSQPEKKVWVGTAGVAHGSQTES